MRLTVVGSADAFNSSGRAHSCYLLEAEGAGKIIVDFGATALMSLKRLGRSPNELDGILFTHLHGDHVGGIPFLVIDGMFNLIRSEPLEILGPVRTESKLAELIETAYGDLDGHVRQFELNTRELAPGHSASFIGWGVEAFAAEHMDPPHRPLCLRVTSPDGRRLAFSGDTAMCDGLFEAARGADLLVAECTSMAPPAGRHCTWQEWSERLPEIDARSVLFTHLSDEVRRQSEALKDSVPGAPRYDFAEDGLVIDL